MRRAPRVLHAEQLHLRAREQRGVEQRLVLGLRGIELLVRRDLASVGELRLVAVDERRVPALETGAELGERRHVERAEATVVAILERVEVDEPREEDRLRVLERV